MLGAYSSLNWSGFGTVSDVQLRYKRDKTDLLVMGYFRVGTPDGNIASLPLPTNFGDINISSLGGTNTNAGNYVRSDVVSGAHGGPLLLPLPNGNLKTLLFASSIVYGSGNTGSTTPAPGNQIVGTTYYVSLNARIPIAEWSAQTNAAIVA